MHRVFDQEGALQAQVANQPPQRMVALGNHAFVFRENPDVRITFVVDRDRATKLTLAQPGGSM